MGGQFSMQVLLKWQVLLLLPLLRLRLRLRLLLLPSPLAVLGRQRRALTTLLFSSPLQQLFGRASRCRAGFGPRSQVRHRGNMLLRPGLERPMQRWLLMLLALWSRLARVLRALFMLLRPSQCLLRRFCAGWLSWQPRIVLLLLLRRLS